VAVRLPQPRQLRSSINNNLRYRYDYHFLRGLGGLIAASESPSPHHPMKNHPVTGKKTIKRKKNQHAVNPISRPPKII